MLLDEITAENVSELSEEEVFNMLTNDVADLPKEKATYYYSLINEVFEFRTISSKNRSLRADLGMFGYKFFKMPDANSFKGIRRKGE